MVLVHCTYGIHFSYYYSHIHSRILLISKCFGDHTLLIQIYVQTIMHAYTEEYMHKCASYIRINVYVRYFLLPYSLFEQSCIRIDSEIIVNEI